MANKTQIEQQEAPATTNAKNIKTCVQCGKVVEVKSFRLLTGKNTSEGYVCRECLAEEKAAAEDETAE